MTPCSPRIGICVTIKTILYDRARGRSEERLRVPISTIHCDGWARYGGKSEEGANTKKSHCKPCSKVVRHLPPIVSIRMSPKKVA